MAELTPLERLQPALLDRLTDDEPGSREESRDKRVLSMQRLRAAVMRDLEWLFNTVRLDALVDLDARPQVRNSVINYGMPALTGGAISNLDLVALERRVRDSIVAFEPRILPKTLKVGVKLNEADATQRGLSFTIHGDLWAQPLPVQIYLRTDYDLETGEAKVRSGD
jgi:type VI secretion system protein ImpF